MRRLNHDGPIDCSLCKRLRPPVLITVGDKEYDEIVDGKRQKLDLSNGDDLLLPEQKYPPECIPCYEFFCGHCYHVQCLARLNPKKYTNITYRKDGIGDTLEIDEFHCLDCRGTQAINYTFNPNKKGGENEEETDTGTIYINVPDAFEKAEKDMKTFLERQLDITDIELNLNYFIRNKSSIKKVERILSTLKIPIEKYLSLVKEETVFPPQLHSLSRQFYYVNRVTHERVEHESVLLKDLMDGLDVHWTQEKKDSLREHRMDVDLLNMDKKSNHEHIRRLNRLVVPIKRYLDGDDDARKLIGEDYITEEMIYGDEHDRRSSDSTCVVNHAGETKRVVTFDDFPIREASSCSIMGGTKRKLIRKRHKTVKNVFCRARTRL